MIRAATEADAPALAEVQARAWRWAYSDFIDHDDMPVAAERVDRWRSQIGAGLRVFDQDGAVVGYAAVDGDEVASLYVDPAAQGAGVGGRLLADAEERLRAAGHRRAWLWVYADNAQGCAFYERRGWRACGERARDANWVADGLRYERDL